MEVNFHNKYRVFKYSSLQQFSLKTSLETALKSSFTLGSTNMRTELEQERQRRKKLESELFELKKSALKVESAYVQDLQVNVLFTLLNDKQLLQTNETHDQLVEKIKDVTEKYENVRFDSFLTALSELKIQGK